MAELIATGESRVDLSPFNPGRFDRNSRRATLQKTAAAL
jgi:hypothetical protein